MERVGLATAHCSCAVFCCQRPSPKVRAHAKFLSLISAEADDGTTAWIEVSGGEAGYVEVGIHNPLAWSRPVPAWPGSCGVAVDGGACAAASFHANIKASLLRVYGNTL